jgi:hypothetical protein
MLNKSMTYLTQEDFKKCKLPKIYMGHLTALGDIINQNNLLNVPMVAYTDDNSIVPYSYNKTHLYVHYLNADKVFDNNAFVIYYKSNRVNATDITESPSSAIEAIMRFKLVKDTTTDNLATAQEQIIAAQNENETPLALVFVKETNSFWITELQ